MESDLLVRRAAETVLRQLARELHPLEGYPGLLTAPKTLVIRSECWTVAEALDPNSEYEDDECCDLSARLDEWFCHLPDAEHVITLDWSDLPSCPGAGGCPASFWAVEVPGLPRLYIEGGGDCGPVLLGGSRRPDGDELFLHALLRTNGRAFGTGIFDMAATYISLSADISWDTLVSLIWDAFDQSCVWDSFSEQFPDIVPPGAQFAEAYEDAEDKEAFAASLPAPWTACEFEYYGVDWAAVDRTRALLCREWKESVRAPSKSDAVNPRTRAWAFEKHLRSGGDFERFLSHWFRAGGTTHDGRRLDASALVDPIDPRWRQRDIELYLRRVIELDDGRTS